MPVLTGTVSVDATHHAGDGMMANDDHTAAVTRSRAEWARLRRRLETVTPGALARVGLTIAAAGVVGGVVLGTWPATLPFLVGGLIAYAVLPIVNRLDGVMPRPLAAAVSVLSVVAVLIGIIAVVLPPLVAGFVQFAATLPGERDVDAALADAEAWLGGQPLGSDVLAPALTSIVLAIRENMESASGGLGDLAVDVARGLAGALGAAIGLSSCRPGCSRCSAISAAAGQPSTGAWPRGCAATSGRSSGSSIGSPAPTSVGSSSSASWSVS